MTKPNTEPTGEPAAAKPIHVFGDPTRPSSVSAPDAESDQAPFRVRQAKSFGAPDLSLTDPEPVQEGQSRLRQEIDDWGVVGAPSEPIVRGGWLRFSTAIAIGLLATAAIVLLICSQVAVLVAQITLLPVGVRELAYIVVVGLVAVILFGAAFLGWRLLRLRRSFRIDVQQLSERKHGQSASKHTSQLTAARQTLVQFLRDYPLGADSDNCRLHTLGKDSELLHALTQKRRELLNDQEATSEAWIERFDLWFLQGLDSIAEKRITAYSRKAAIGTGMSRSGPIDTLIVVANSYAMLNDLLTIYNLRSSSWGTVRLLIHAFANAFVASRLDDWGDVAAEELIAAAPRAMGSASAAASAIGGVVTGHPFLASAAAKVGSGMADGFANNYLLRRLARAVVREIRPIRHRLSTS